MLCLLLLLAAFAQDDWGNLGRLRPGDRVKVVRTDMQAVEGAFQSVSADAITVESQAVARTDVVRVTRMGGRGRNAGIGAAIGAGVGLGAAAILLAATGGSDLTGSILAGGAIYGAGGGAAIGALVPPGTTLYRAPRK